MTFEDWYKTTVGITVADAKARGVTDIELMRQCWKASRTVCAEQCREVGVKHQQDENTYSAGKKAGAFECAEILSA